MEWVPVVENLGLPTAMVLVLLSWLTAIGGFVAVVLWKHFFVPVKDGVLASLKENSDTNQAILKQVSDQEVRTKETITKVAQIEERQSGFHDFLQKAGGYQMLMAGAGHAKSNGEKLDRIEQGVKEIKAKLP